jgi:hypothetical protein
MSKQRLPLLETADPDCRAPLVAEPLDADQAERLALSFKALGTQQRRHTVNV